MSSPSKKVRADSLLRNLPVERQEQIIEWCNTPKSETCPGGYQHAREQLAADGVKVSLQALSGFYSWYQLKAQYEAAEAHAEQQEELMRQFRPDDLELARKFGKFVFLQEANRRKDGKLFATVEQLIQGDETGALNKRKQEFKEKIEPRKLDLLERRVEVAERKLVDVQKALEPLKDASTPEDQRKAILEEVDRIMGIPKKPEASK
jgi:hypothetical protein